MNKQEQKQFDKFLEDNEIHFVNPVKNEDKNLIKQFISQIKANQRKEIMEMVKIEKMKALKCPLQILDNYNSGYNKLSKSDNYNAGYDKALDKVIKTLK